MDERYYHLTKSQMWVMKKEVYQCPKCSRTAEWPMLSTAVPDRICKCDYPDSVTEMERLVLDSLADKPAFMRAK